MCLESTTHGPWVVFFLPHFTLCQYWGAAFTSQPPEPARVSASVPPRASDSAHLPSVLSPPLLPFRRLLPPRSRPPPAPSDRNPLRQPSFSTSSSSLPPFPSIEPTWQHPSPASRARLAPLCPQDHWVLPGKIPTHLPHRDPQHRCHGDFVGLQTSACLRPTEPEFMA